MSLTVNTNMASLTAQRNLANSTMSLNQSLQRLSSGLRINSAADDPAGLGISEKMQGQINGLNQASSNAQTGINLLQTAEGSLNTIQSILQRQRTLSVQGASDTLTSNDRTNIQTEMNQLTSELDRIASSSSFNTQNLLDGSFTGKSFQIGANAGDVISIGIITISSAALTVNNLSVGSQALASTSISNIDVALNAISTQRANLGALENRLQDTISNLGVASENLTASQSTIQDTDFASEVANMTKNQLLVQAGTSILAQANQSTSAVMNLLH